MKVALIGPTDFGAHGNPGWHMITSGIRHLVLRVVPQASFVALPMGSSDPVDWMAAATCDVAILCGNPRFTMSVGNAYWENGIWDDLVTLQRGGTRVIDGWAGSAFPFNAFSPRPEEMALAIMFFPGRQARLEQAKEVHGRITRDPTMQMIYERAGARSTLLPCSSWWARRDYGVNVVDRSYDLFIGYRMAGQESTVERLIERKLGDLPMRVVATTWQDYGWMERWGAELITDPASLLRLYAGARNVLSYRLHAAIPAASLGCNVVAVSIDSRTDTCQPFDIPVLPFENLDSLEVQHRLQTAVPPDEEFVLTTLKGLLC